MVLKDTGRVEDNTLPPTEPPKEEKTNVIRLMPKKVVEESRNIAEFRDVFMRKQKCYFENNFNGGCKCNYCIYINMTGQRVFEMIKNDFQYQAKKGSMVFTSQDMADVLQSAVERVIALEKNSKNPPPTEPPKK